MVYRLHKQPECGLTLNPAVFRRNDISCQLEPEHPGFHTWHRHRSKVTWNHQNHVDHIISARFIQS